MAIKERKTTTSINVFSSILDKVEYYAVLRQTSRNNLIAEILTEWVKKQEKEV